MHEYFVYMLCCSDGSYYTGVTNDVELRMAQHERGDDASCYTFRRRPVILVYRCGFRDVIDAIAYEKKLKGWSRKKKEALVRGEYERLPALSAMKGDWEIATAVRSVRFQIVKFTN